MGWCCSKPEHRLRLPLDSVPMFKFLCIPFRDGSGPFLFPPSKSHPGSCPPEHSLLLSPFVLFAFSPSITRIQPPPSSVWSPPSSVPYRPSAGELPTLRLRPTNVLFWFPDPASHMQACTPPRPIRLVVLGLGESR